MSSIKIFNRATTSAQGSGLPFYENISDCFSVQNNGFNSDIGLWRVPVDKVPTFQVFVDELYDTIQRFVWYETKGENNFTGVTFTPAGSGGLQSTAVTVNGVKKIVWSSFDTFKLIPNAPEGRYQAELYLINALNPVIRKTIWSEEFVVSDCC